MNKPTLHSVLICSDRVLGYYPQKETEAYIKHLEAKLSEAENRLKLVRLQRDKAAAPNVYLRPFGEDAQKTFCICEADHPFSIPARLMKGDDDE